jgi:phosphoenolpyruvate carboxykinase (ATP)
MGGFAAVTAPTTGRSPNDKFTVRESATEKTVDWGKVNVAMDRAAFDRLRADVVQYLNGQDLYVRDCRAGADDAYGLNVRVVA